MENRRSHCAEFRASVAQSHARSLASAAARDFIRFAIIVGETTEQLSGWVCITAALDGNMHTRREWRARCNDHHQSRAQSPINAHRATHQSGSHCSGDAPSLDSGVSAGEGAPSAATFRHHGSTESARLGSTGAPSMGITS